MALTTNVPRPILQTTSYMSNGISMDIQGVKFPLQTGVPAQSLYMFKIIPATFSSTCVSSPNAWQVGGQPLNQRNTGVFPNLISTALNATNALSTASGIDTINGILLDCERGISFTFSGGTTINPTTATVTGFDYRGKALIFTVSLNSTDLFVTASTPISVVTSVVFSPTFRTTGGTQTVSIGNSAVIGLPYYLPDTSYVVNATWNGTALTSADITPGNNWRLNPASITSGAPRGFIGLPSDPNGYEQLTCCYYVLGSDSELNAEINNANQSSLKIASIVKSTPTLPNVPSSNVLPYLTQYDLTGVVYPADNAFIYTYSQALKA